MPQFCILCGHKITTEVKVFEGNTFDTRCHRKVITDEYSSLVQLIPYLVKRMFVSSDVDRAEYRSTIRECIATYRSLSY